MNVSFIKLTLGQTLAFFNMQHAFQHDFFYEDIYIDDHYRYDEYGK